MATSFVGIDPGISGGIAIITPKGAMAEKMPMTVRDTWELLEEYISGHRNVVACLEKVHSSPQMGVRSAFTFGKGFGGLEMALVSLKVPYELVTPQKWQRAVGALTGGDKNVTKARAQQLWPHIKMTHCIADALLIAEYAKRAWVP